MDDRTFQVYDSVGDILERIGLKRLRFGCLEVRMEDLSAILKHLKRKWKPDPVLLAAWGLAVVSAFFVHPDSEYVAYIDWRSLGILW